MTISRKNKAAFGLLAGLSVLCALFAWRGIAAVGELLSQAGFGLVLICLFKPPEQMLAADSWRLLFPANARPTWARALLASWMGSAVNSLLPVATVGGEIVKARAVILWGSPVAETMAATAVDKTIQAITIVLWGLIGAGCLMAVAGPSPATTGMLVVAVPVLLGIAGLVAVAVKGGVAMIAGKAAAYLCKTPGTAPLGKTLVDGAAAVQRLFADTYRDPLRLSAATALRLGQRLFFAGEVVLIGYLMGQPVDVVAAIVLNGLIGAIRGASFVVPAALGVQEGGYAAVGALLGYPPDLMIAVSLATRVREVLTSVPLLLAWQATEGRALWTGRRPGP